MLFFFMIADGVFVLVFFSPYFCMIRGIELLDINLQLILTVVLLFFFCINGFEWSVKDVLPR